MRMSDLNRFDIPKHFVIDWEHVGHMLDKGLSPTDRELLDRYFPKHTATRTSSSTSGEVPVKQVPQSGEQWWVKVPDQPRLVLVWIIEITGVSVSIRVDGHHTLLGLRDGRYERNYMKFIEKYVQPSLEPKPV